MTAPNRTRHAPRPLAAVALVALVALGAGLLGACDLGPVVSPSPSGASPGPSRPPSTQTLSDALDALDGLASYRFVRSVVEGLGGGIAQARGVVLNGTERRTRVEYTSGGAFAGGQVTIGNRTWVSVSGAAYQAQDDPGGPGGTDWINPVAQAFDPWALGLDDVEDLGVETHAGVAARHLRSAAIADPAPDADGLPTGTTFSGTADAWIAVDGGYLVAATATGTQDEGSGDGTGPPASPSAYSLDVVVEGVNDPANAVEAPGTTVATASPGGDPAADRLVRGIAGALARLDSYVFSISATTGGMETSGTLTVVNASKAAQVEYGALAGFDGLAIRVVGDRAWTRVGSGPWSRGSPSCGAGGDSTAAAGRCTFARLSDVGAVLLPTRSTFAVVEEDETVDGVASTHLRSEAGLDQAGFTIPGTWDVWIANDGGYLVRGVFTGEGLSTSMAISRVDDPANVLPAPGR